MKIAHAPPQVNMPDRPPLYRISEARLHKARHAAANALQRACANGHQRSAEQWARVVARCDDALGNPGRTSDGWAELIHDLLAFARPKPRGVAMDDVFRAMGSE